MTDSIIGFSGVILTASTSALRDEVSAWVTLGCSVAIAICTCAVQLYRLWRDRNSDKKK